MAETTLLLNGFSIIGNPHTNTNAAFGGNLFVHGGDAIFDASDIIVFTVENVTEAGVLTGDSVVTGVVVYDNATDYYYDVPLYTYSAQAGGGGEIDFNRNSMGDRYLEFDASSLTSSDPAAPELGTLALVAGVDILNTLDSINGPLKIPRIESIDLDGDGLISTDEEADASYSRDLNILAVICFAAGTLIETPKGPQYIETLQEGDLVNTLDAGAQPIRWIGAMRVPGKGSNAPVEITPGALGNVRLLRVSQNHRMLISGPRAELLFGQSQVLVAAKHLVDDCSIRVQPKEEITYVHFLFDNHQIVFAEGCPAESLYPGTQTLETVAPEERDEIIARFPEIAHHRGRRGKLSRYTLRGYEAEALRTA